MKVKTYKGIRNDNEFPYYFIDVNIDFDISTLKDESGNPYQFIGYSKYKGEISCWKPFIAEYKDYTGKQRILGFKCPICGACNCERPNQIKLADPYFFQGNFKCSNCGTSDFNYYSNCFIESDKRVQQLSLF